MENCYFKIPPEATQEIRKVYSLDKPGRLEEAINILEEWIQKQDHFTKKDFSKGYLERSLITCKGSVEKAKKQIDRCCTMKTLMPKFFTNTNVKLELGVMLDLARMVPLPQLTQDYYRIVLIEFRQLREITGDMFLKYFQTAIIIGEYLKSIDYPTGFIIIDDFRNTNVLELATKMNSVEFQQFVTILIEGYGARLKGYYCITESKAIEIVIKMVKQLLSEKISSRIHVVRSIEELHESVPKELLPEDFGGNEASIEKLQKTLVEELSSEKNVEYLKMMFNARSDESKRNSAKFNEEYMGMAGAFRNLSVD